MKNLFTALLLSLTVAGFTQGNPPTFNGSYWDIQTAVQYPVTKDTNLNNQGFADYGALSPTDPSSYGSFSAKYTRVRIADSIAKADRHLYADWIIVRFVGENNTYEFVALLRKDKHIVNFRGEPLHVNIIPASYWIEIVHRSSVTICSAIQYSSNSSQVIKVNLLDPNNVYGKEPLIYMKYNVYGSYGGETSGDDYVDGTDENDIYNHQGAIGSIKQDINGDGKCDLLDSWQMFSNFDRHVQRPKRNVFSFSNTFEQSYPLDKPEYKLLTTTKVMPSPVGSMLEFTVNMNWTNPDEVKQFKLSNTQLVLSYNEKYFNNQLPFISASAINNVPVYCSASNGRIVIHFLTYNNSPLISENGTEICKFRINIAGLFESSQKLNLQWINGAAGTTKIFSILSNHSDSSFNITTPSTHFIGDVISPETETVSLSQNFPNPFNPVTVISYSIPENNFTNIKVYNSLGKEVVTLVNENQNAGSYSVRFNGNNLASGIYFYKLTSGKFSEVKQMVLVK